MSSSVSVKSDRSNDKGPNFSGEPSRTKWYLICFLFVFTQTVSESLSVNNYHKTYSSYIYTVVFFSLLKMFTRYFGNFF